MCLHLTAVLFTDDELASSNIIGNKGKNKLDPRKVEAIISKYSITNLEDHKTNVYNLIVLLRFLNNLIKFITLIK